MKRACCLAVSLSLLLCLSLASQQKPSVLRISAGVAEGMLAKKVEPVYPEMARIAHIQGNVVLSIIISTEGKVTSLRVVSGHPILIQSAIDAVRQWEYRPYKLNGEPVRVDTTVTVRFSFLTPEERARFEAAAHAYHEQAERCTALAQQRAYADAEATCSKLPELSEKLDPTLISERVRAYRYIGMAFFSESKFHEARAAFFRELGFAKSHLDPADLEMARAYVDVAHGTQTTSDEQEATSYYDKAVEILEHARAASTEMGGSPSPTPGMQAALTAELRVVLRDYALLLRQMGKMDEAEAAEKKAQALSNDVANPK